MLRGRCSNRGNGFTMQLGKLLITATLLLATGVPCMAFTHARRGPTSPRLSNKHARPATKPAGQRGIDDARATQIQASLIKSGYLSGEASGHWDSQTESAMQKFQEDNGWQTKLIPDSRAIIKLGLGPQQDSKLSAGTSSAMAAPSMSPAPGFMQR
jgi:peptidoglycan hydrolase-like protein with peptidoglycan-binding domain